jgi:acetyltransferase
VFEVDWKAWEAMAGPAVRVRAIEPEDLEREREFVAGLSRQTAYQRLMSGRTPTEAELQRWTRIDRSREGALVATVTIDGRERQIGVARYGMEGDDGEAEFAIVVGDAWHGRGLGAQLLGALIELARISGVRRLVGITLSDNQAMLALGRRLGFRFSRRAGSGFITTLSLALHSAVAG